MRARSLVICLLVTLLGAACSHEPRGHGCPGFPDLGRWSSRQLREANIAPVPLQGATSLANVRRAERRSRRFIKDHYPHAIEIGIGRGWGVTHSVDEFGNETFHHRPDHMLVVVLRGRANCPDLAHGLLYVFGNDALRVPVRFLYRNAK